MIMKQNYSIIKLFMLTIMAFFAGNAMAEDVIWQEDFSSFQKDQLPTGGTYQYACEGAVLNEDGSVKSGTKVYAEALAGGTAPELLVAKNGGSFSATIALKGKSGDMNLQFKTNRDNMTVEVTGATLGEKQRSGNTDTYALTGASGTLTIKIKAGNSNARLDDIKLYQGTALKPAGLSWGKASTSVTMGDEASYANLPGMSQGLPFRRHQKPHPCTHPLPPAKFHGTHHQESSRSAASCATAGHVHLPASGPTNGLPYCYPAPASSPAAQPHQPLH